MQIISNSCDFTNLILKNTELVDLDPEKVQEAENDLDKDNDNKIQWAEIYQQNITKIEADSNDLLGQLVDTKDQEEDNNE
ncbi:19915_t:CDS:2 [Gigaspora margarita]|uniref:19915_t:CDS:1 n=1 Tax=Gigaspora margarita TaxID=4874 RepID=A0ABN7WU24_GIGMA|nr:19915_t:CDS:2 [Gigaspora margarita]